ncbi:hypothetical protein FRB97_001896 [Tulasnella sp. 331]|nr:hypothetical protein FRB97_001896 [Tulasnella sp. 331]KAG8870477.1 hypothetical protein FRB98_001592 [Tulasnella sp. 332]
MVTSSPPSPPAGASTPATTGTRRTPNEELVIRPFVKHIIRRVDEFRREGDPGDPDGLVLKERTEPADREKELFFRHLLSNLMDAKGCPGKMGPRFLVQMLAFSAATDLYPVVVDVGPRWVGWYVTYAMLLLGTVFAKIMGIKALNDEYTIEELMVVPGRKDI